MKSTILIIEDDLAIQQFLVAALSNYGFSSIAYTTGTHGLAAYEAKQPDLILLDVQLPDMSGFEVCQSIRAFSNVPIIFISCLHDGADIIYGLELGGDDYVTKPFDLHQLIARIKSNLRRAPLFHRQLLTLSKNTALPADILTIGALEINFRLQKAFINKKPVPLSAKEFQILSILAEHPYKAFTAHELYTQIWGADSLGETRTLKVHISHLRKKIEAYTGLIGVIRTKRGLGYQLGTDIYPALLDLHNKN